MNIVIANSPKYIVQNIASVLEFALKDRINTYLWDKGQLSTYDMFDLARPDIVLMFAKDISNDFTGLIEENPQTKFVIMECEGIFEPFIAFNPDPACNPLQYVGKQKEKYGGRISAFSNGSSFQPFYDVLETAQARIYGESINSTAYVGNVRSVKERADIIKSTTEVFVAFNEYEMLNAYLLGTPCTTFGLNPAKYPCESSFSDVESLVKTLYRPSANRLFAIENTAFHQTHTLFSLLNIPDYDEAIWTSLQSLGL